MDKVERKEYMKNWRRKNQKRTKAYRERNKTRINEQRRKRNHETGQEKEYLQKLRAANPEVYRLYRRAWLKKNRVSHAEMQKSYANNNPEKILAQRTAAKLPLKARCELCPEGEERSENLQHHHPDYSEPLATLTACPSCHKYAEQGVE